MPYVITTKRVSAQADGWLARSPFHDTRTTVATLDEAREAASDAVDAAHTATGQSYNRRWEGWAATDLYVSESGGTIGPLPDGTVIEVRPDNTNNV